MRSSLLIALSLVLLPVLKASGSASKGYGKKTLSRYFDGEVLVKFSPRSSFSSNKKNLQQRFGAQAALQLGKTGLTRVKLKQGQTVEQAIQEISQDSSVEFVEPNYRRWLATVPNDPIYSSQWGLKNSGQTISSLASYTNYDSVIVGTINPGTSGKDMDLENAWSIASDCSSITVAVIDTGVNYNHEDLSANMWTSSTYPYHGYDFLDNDNDPMDPLLGAEGHGTHVAGIIGAVGNNGLGGTGVCWKANIMALRAGDVDGLSSANVIDAVNFAVSNGAKVVNMSFGGPDFSASEQTAFANAKNNGVLLVAAAGNGGADGLSDSNDSTPQYPCNYSGMLCVAAVDQKFDLASFSNYGATSVQVAAPGVNILSIANGTIADGSLDTLSSWTLSSATWAHQSNLTIATQTIADVLTNPATWDGTTVNYAASVDAHAYKAFDLSGYADATMNFSMVLSSQAGQDGVILQALKTGGDPFTSGTVLDTFSGELPATAYSYSLQSCLASTCSAGFRFISNADATVGHGAAIYNLWISTLTASTTKYRIMSGTSMAAPYVAGIGAMIMAYNPRYSVDDAIASLEQGGVAATSLVGKTKMEKVVSASGSLKYIIPPTNISASVR